jgi:hypothetical protein
VSVAVARWRWRFYARRLGDTHPRVRALFGRYVATMGGYITETAGVTAHRAYARAAHTAGYQNRTARKHRTG